MQYTVNEIMPELAAKANSFFKKTKFEDMVEGSFEGGIDAPGGTVNVNSNGDITAGKSLVTVKAGVANVSISAGCNSNGDCATNVALSKSVSILHEDFASAEGAVQVSSDAKIQGSIKGKFLTGYIQGNAVVNMNAVNQNGTSLMTITENSIRDMFRPKN